MIVMTNGAPTLREQQRALARLRLLDAAEAVFARRGYHGASVDEIAREAGATSGALYSNFTSKEELFLALFERSAHGDVHEYSQAFGSGENPDEEARGVADLWMRILRERPHYFPLIVEFWAYAMREPQLREPLAQRFATLRAAAAHLIAEGAEHRGIAVGEEFAGRLGLIVIALGNGLALQKLIDPGAVPDELYGDMLVLLFKALAALAEQTGEADGVRS